MQFADLSEPNRATIEQSARRSPWGRDAVMTPQGVLTGCDLIEIANDERPNRRRIVAFSSMAALAEWRRLHTQQP